MDRIEIEQFAERYATAWCSDDPTRVAAHFSPEGSLTILESQGQFDAAEYERQLAHGLDEST